MDPLLSPEPITDPEKLLEAFEELMPFRVRDILLVSSLYDSFILREDGRLNELLIGDSLELHLQHIPGITHVSSGPEALELVRSDPRFNLIVTNLTVGSMSAAELARQVKEAGLDVPVVVLAYDYRQIKDFVARNPVTDIDRIFLWQGNVRILIALIKYIEDKRNVAHDTSAMGVPVILLVEDNIRYCSSFLPVIYTELITQSRSLFSEGLNVAHKLVRMRARPKILLCSNYEDAAEQAIKYREYLFGVVSDVEFPLGGKLTPDAGFELANMVRSLVPDVPIVLHSSRTKFMAHAHAEGYSFLRKRSPTMLGDLRRLLTEHFAFGDFVFRRPDRSEVARAKDLTSLEKLLHQVPAECLAYHSERNHFSRWLRARTEFALAQKLRPRKVSDFATLADLRLDIINSIAEYRREQRQALIGDFSPSAFQPNDTFFLRIGGGSLGGKARGLAFVRHLFRERQIAAHFPGVNIAVPSTLVLATDVYDQFLAENDLLELAIRSSDEKEIEQRFLAASLPAHVRDNLLAFLTDLHYPLAVRSSSLLEDSQYQPFTGVYETFMLSNQHPDLRERMNQLSEAIKRVYASTFSERAKAYVRATPYRLEEEKMAVIIQQVVGAIHGKRFYPDFSGVARSQNFYPVAPMTAADGVTAVALGLGREVVEGGKSLAFCPRYPQNLIQFSSVEDILANSQTEFWALELDHLAGYRHKASDLREVRYGLRAAETDGTLPPMASTYSIDNHAIYDGVSRPGPRVVTFAPILKYGVFPLAGIVDQLTKLLEDALGRPVELEFAVRLPQRPDEIADFGFLQMRPLVVSREWEEVRMEQVEPGRLLCESSRVLGNGRIQDIQDIVVVDFQHFERARSREVAHYLAHLNAQLIEAGISYLLIGVGRWGSTDPWLGIPVTWDQISGARVIVETGLSDLQVTPSQGSHFFQNLVAFQVGYFTINSDAGEGFVDWDWLASQPALENQGCVRHLRLQAPLLVVMNGKTSRGIIVKPEAQ
ncbi:MAG: PEP/pyruvate-binding domain-containing protein [Candidatus Korobacteraceae bacterium]